MTKLFAIAIALVLACTAVQPAKAQQKKTSSAQQTASQHAALQQQVTSQQKQIKELQDALDALKQENSELERQLEEVRIEKGQVQEDLDQLRATLKENQSGGDSLLKELQQTKSALLKSESKLKSLETEAAALRDRVEDSSALKEGTLVQLGPDVIPAECINLRRMTPSTKNASGVVVVNVLISERGDPLDVRIIQKLPGDETKWTAKAHEACIEAAKRLAFHPATTKDGSTRLRVWQGVGFNLN